MVRTRRFYCRGLGSIPGRGTKILQAARCGQKHKINKFFLKELSALWRRAHKVRTAKLMSLRPPIRCWGTLKYPVCSQGLLAITLIHLYLSQVLSFLLLCSMPDLSERALRYRKNKKKKRQHGNPWNLTISLLFLLSSVSSLIFIHSSLFGKVHWIQNL